MNSLLGHVFVHLEMSEVGEGKTILPVNIQSQIFIFL